MARPTQDAIDTFVSITGASEAAAVQKLEESGGDLNRAINAHFSERDASHTNQAPFHAPSNDDMDIDDPVGPMRAHFPSLSASEDLNPFSLLDSTFRRNFFNGIDTSGYSTRGARVSHPREVREVPIEFKDDNGAPASGLGPRIEDITGSETAHGPEIRGTVIIDDDDEDAPIAPATDSSIASVNESSGQYPRPVISPVIDVDDYNNEIEEEMIRAAIEASKREAEQHSAEEESVAREQGVYVGEDSFAPSDMQIGSGRTNATDARQGFSSAKTETSRQAEAEDPFLVEEPEDVEEQPLVRNRSRRISSRNSETEEIGQVSHSSSSPPRHDIQNHPQYNGRAFQTDEWGGISSEEHDEAVMLEAAMFGGIPEGTGYRFAYPPRQDMEAGSYRNSSQYPTIPRAPSPTLTEQRLLREQQDDEYLAALLADQEKELKAKQEAELEEEENLRKQMEEEELERKLAAKEASLPVEPSSDDENAVTLLVRLPDGSRRGRRFLKSDKLQLLFDFIDVGRIVKPGSYRLVRPYPRLAFTDGESGISLKELGLSSKQEALFLELI